MMWRVTQSILHLIHSASPNGFSRTLRTACAALALAALGASTALAQSRGGGGDIIVWDIVDSVSQLSRTGTGTLVLSNVNCYNANEMIERPFMLVGESKVAGVFEVLVDMGDSIAWGWLCEVDDPKGSSGQQKTQLIVGLQFKF